MKNKYVFLALLSMLLSFNSNTFAQETEIDHVEMIIEPSIQWRYLADNTNPGDNWFEINYNDQSWNVGAGGIGYNDGDVSNTYAGWRVFHSSKPIY